MATSLVDLLPADLRLEPRIIPAEQNAWEPLQDAGRLFVGRGDDLPRYWPPNDPRNEGFSGSEAEVRAWLTANEPAIAALDEAIARGALAMPDPHADLSMEFRVVLGIARLLTLRVRMQLANQKNSAAADDAIRLLRTAQLVLRSNTGNAVSGMLMLVWASHLLREIADAGTATSKLLARLLEQASTTRGLRRQYVKSIRSSVCLCAIPTLERFNRAGLSGSGEQISALVDHVVGRDDNEPDINDEDLATAASQHAVRRELFRACVGYLLRDHPHPYDERLTVEWLVSDSLWAIGECRRLEPRRWCDVRGHAVKWLHWWRQRGRNRARSALPAWLWTTWHAEFDELAEHRPDDDFRVDDYYSIYVRPDEDRLEQARLRMRAAQNPIGVLALGELTPCAPVFLLRVNEATLGLTELVIALRLYELRNGRLPRRLRELVRAGILDRLPVDPFSGRSFYYNAKTGTVWSAGDAEDPARWSEKPSDSCARRLAWQLAGHRGAKC
jgi:hypothetical protein